MSRIVVVTTALVLSPLLEILETRERENARSHIWTFRTVEEASTHWKKSLASRAICLTAETEASRARTENTEAMAVLSQKMASFLGGRKVRL
ncbi:hypothetical protein Taro_048776 [Colocasia esculenta]|uniref:Secreted protein n=1 Tax=Colocasia esculenta TaxID=4460 RepID=A0A843X929_COLES|nr:hypothetical protein [Colocasia esculenta]